MDSERPLSLTRDLSVCRGVDLDPSSVTPWLSIFTQDHGGAQQWAQGEKGNVCSWFSLMHHYRVEVPHSDWQIESSEGHRPLVYLNTCNHMIGERDNNEHMLKHEWKNYAFQPGDPQDAFLYVVDHVPTKSNLYSVLCFWNARNGGGCCDRHPSGKVTRHGESIYIKHVEQPEANVTKAEPEIVVLPGTSKPVHLTE